MNFLEFEQPIADLYAKIDQLNETGKREHVTTQEKVRLLEYEIRDKQREIYSNLTVWQRIMVSRHPDRPYSLFYMEYICDQFIELFGDRSFKDDKAIVGGLGNIDGKTYMLIGHQKGNNTKMRQYRNFGM